jgi:hypothetical protein
MVKYSPELVNVVECGLEDTSAAENIVEIKQATVMKSSHRLLDIGANFMVHEGESPENLTKC